MKWMFMPLRRYADFTGRSRRMEYWMWVLLNSIVMLLLFVPLCILAYNAISRVADRGGVDYRSGSYDSSYDRDSYDRDEDSDRSRDDRDRGSSLYDDDRDSGASRFDEEDRGSSRSDDADRDPDSADPADEDQDSGGYASFSYSYGYSMNVDPYLLMQEFGPAAWILIGLYSLWGLVTFIPGLAVGIRRLHDTDRSGWWLFIAMVPLVGAIILIVFFLTEGTRGPNRFGPDPKAGLAPPTYT